MWYSTTPFGQMHYTSDMLYKSFGIGCSKTLMTRTLLLVCGFESFNIYPSKIEVSSAPLWHEIKKFTWWLVWEKYEWMCVLFTSRRSRVKSWVSSGGRYSTTPSLRCLSPSRRTPWGPGTCRPAGRCCWSWPRSCQCIWSSQGTGLHQQHTWNDIISYRTCGGGIVLYGLILELLEGTKTNSIFWWKIDNMLGMSMKFNSAVKWLMYLDEWCAKNDWRSETRILYTLAKNFSSGNQYPSDLTLLILTLVLKEVILLLEVVYVLLVGRILASHELDVVSRLLQDLCPTCL